MKKYIIILFSLFYFAVASGITMNFHYCGGKLKHVSLFEKDHETGCCGSKKKSKGCCNDKTSYVKIKDNYKPNDLVKAPLNFKQIVINEEILLFTSLPKLIDSYNVLNYHAPPVFYDNPLYLKYRVLLI